MYKTVGDSVATVVALNLGRDANHRFGTYREALLFFMLCIFLLDSMPYLLLITLISTPSSKLHRRDRDNKKF